MSLNKRGIMVVLSSPSGAGKTTLVKLLSKKKNFYTSISHTTRKPRVNEVDGVDYFFVKEKKFKNLIKNNKFLEYATVFKNLYGTTKEQVIMKLSNGENVLFDIDWQGTEQIKSQKLNFKLITFFILPPSKKVLFQRLSNRDMKDKLIVEERMRQFDKDILHWKKYNYTVVNDNLQKCFRKITNIINKEIKNKKYKYNKLTIEKYIQKLI
tara:strand:+ start:233 stop:862 length:630 start_codon:yes stop_codon:yes gene_type:complete